MKTISAGWDHACAIKRDGTPVCWGSDENGQSTVPADAAPAAAISAGYQTCVLKTDRRVVCWAGGRAGRPPAAPSPRPPDGVVGTPYAFQFDTTWSSLLFETREQASPPPSFVLTAGSLPPGLMLSPGGDIVVEDPYKSPYTATPGVLTGIPTTPGAYTFTISADDGIFEPASSQFIDVRISAPPAGTPPANTTRPVIRGRPQPGATLTAKPGNWTGDQPIGYAYQWARCTTTTGCGHVPTVGVRGRRTDRT